MRSTALVIAGLCAAVMLFARAAGAREVTVLGRSLDLSISEGFTYSYFADDGNLSEEHDRFHQFTNVLDVALSRGDLRLGARFDVHLFADSPEGRLCAGSAPPRWCGERYQNHFATERVFFIASRPEFEVTLGDFYVSLGKGIALNVVKIDELGQDTTIRGGKFVLHHGELEATFVAGEFNPLDTDQATGVRAPWSLEPVIGGRLERRFLERLIVGVHGVYIITDDPNAAGTSADRTDCNAVWGAGLELPDLWEGLFSLAGELDVQHTVKAGQTIRGLDVGGGGPSGLAAYASTTFHRGDVTILGEFKHYDNYRLQAASVVGEPYTLTYSQPPTLERVNAEVYDNSHVTGGRLRVDYNLGQHGPLDLLVFANYGYFHDWVSGDHRIHDPFGGLELQWQEGKGHLTLTAGVRRETDEEAGEVYHQDAHVELDVEQAVAARHSLKLTAVYQRRERQAFAGTQDWNELDLALGYKWSPSLALGVSYERQEDPLVLAERRTTEPLLGMESYLAGTAQYFFTPGTYLSLRAGTNRPGIKCLNGVCRRYPGFAGVQLGLVARF